MEYKNGEKRTEFSETPLRPRAYDENIYPWSYHRIPKTITVDGVERPHPARSCGVFVVHGMGDPQWTETAATLRSGFEDACEAITAWQAANSKDKKAPALEPWPLPPPYIHDGYWANFTDIEKTFPNDWEGFNENQQKFFSKMWRTRALSVSRTVVWYLKQQFGLWSTKVRDEVGVLPWLIYFPLALVAVATLVISSIRYRKMIEGFLADVRLYLDPQGVIEKSIVQEIDHRVGERFLKMIGLDWDFKPLREDKRLSASGEMIVFDRVVWVSHSLGSVISYNVLSDLFKRAREIGKTGTAPQKKGVKKFRATLKRFVTMGSPLDKIAFLFGDKSLRPMPEKGRVELLDAGEKFDDKNPAEKREWWFNFYHFGDPVSGALSNPYICGADPPTNVHIEKWHIPGFSHTSYWRDITTLRFILTRTYGTDSLPDQKFERQDVDELARLALWGNVLWLVVVVFAVGVLGALLASWWHGLFG